MKHYLAKLVLLLVVMAGMGGPLTSCWTTGGVDGRPKIDFVQTANVLDLSAVFFEALAEGEPDPDLQGKMLYVSDSLGAVSFVMRAVDAGERPRSDIGAYVEDLYGLMDVLMPLYAQHHPESAGAIATELRIIRVSVGLIEALTAHQSTSS